MRPQIISFNCILKNAAGRLISQTYNREVLNAMSPDASGALSGLNKNLQNLTRGEKRRFRVPAEEAYGLYDPNKVILFPRRKLPKSVMKGEKINIVGSGGVARSYRVIEFHEDFARLDGNHPLAGQDLIFEIEALDARDATPEDLELSTNRVSNQLLH
jgi:FKBP-type peptidyl-prolyl cis-trans isomerase SlyD